jgi:hypothetical protein
MEASSLNNIIINYKIGIENDHEHENECECGCEHKNECGCGCEHKEESENKNELRIFGDKFVENNRNNCFIYYKEKI